jgi:asparagine synthase (glutamine-hydrolysing)
MHLGMCGIWALLHHYVHNRPQLSEEEVEGFVSRLTARGPEGTRIKKYLGPFDVMNATLGFTRLAINGLHDGGMQPFEYVAPNGHKYAWICNGEIYNWKELAKKYQLEGVLTSGSDCEVLGPLWYRMAEDGADAVAFARALDGVFAFVMVDLGADDSFAGNQLIVGRDPYGVRPLFYSREAGSTCFSSELKALVDGSEAAVFPPGTILQIPLYRNWDGCAGFHRYHTVPNVQIEAFKNLEAAEMALEKGLRAAVRKRLLTERPVAALLSGGVDSSLIAALVAQELAAAGAGPLKTFSIGFEGSKDLEYARQVAEWIGSDHNEIVMTPDEFFAAIPEVVKAIESYDVTTVRASVGNYLVAKAIRERSDCKVVFNGDGSDEIFGSYLYFYGAPSDEAFERETERLLEDIHYFDVLRSDRSISSNGLEARTPFLDKSFVAIAKALPTRWRRPGTRHGECEPICEKWILRRAFYGLDLLPPEVLWRRKEAFSDGVSGPARSWYEEIQERVDGLVEADWADQAAILWPQDASQPTSAEAFYYRQLFESYYPGRGCLTVPYKWMPRWVAGATDPSARTLAIYNPVSGT